MLTVAIVGSRASARPAAVRAFVAALARKHPGCEAVSGGARGVDSIAAAATREVGLAVREFPADWAHLGHGAGLVRTHAIVEAASVEAVWNGQSRGTAHTIGPARGRQVVVYR